MSFEQTVNKIFARLPEKVKQEYYNSNSSEQELFGVLIKKHYDFALGKLESKALKGFGGAKNKRASELVGLSNSILLANKATQEFVSLFDQYKFSKNFTLHKFFHQWDTEKKKFVELEEVYGQYHALFQRIDKQAQSESKDWQKYLLEDLLDNKLSKKIEEIVSNKRLAKEAAQEFVSLFDQYKFSESYTLSNFFHRWDVEKKKFLKQEEGHGQYYALFKRIYKQAKNKNKDWQKYLLEDLLDNKLSKKVEEIVSNKRLAKEVAQEFVSLFDQYKFSKNFTLHKFFHQWDTEKKKFIKYGEGCGQYLALFERIDKRTAKSKDKDWQKYLLEDLLDKKLSKEVEEIISDKRLAKEAAQEFISLFDQYKFSKKSYTLKNFFGQWDTEKKKFIKWGESWGQYCALFARIYKQAKVKRKDQDWQKYLLTDLLDKKLSKEVEEIVSGRKLIEYCLKKYIKNYWNAPVSAVSLCKHFRDLQIKETKVRTRSGKIYRQWIKEKEKFPKFNDYVLSKTDYQELKQKVIDLISGKRYYDLYIKEKLVEAVKVYAI